jgi:hypothetical protein
VPAVRAWRHDEYKRPCYRAFRARVVPVWRLLIVPAIFISWGLLSVAQRSVAVPALSLDWIAAVAVGSVIGWAATRLGAYGFEAGGRVRVPGTPITLVRTLLIFIARYGIAVAAAFVPDAAGHARIVTWEVAVSGLAAGYFAGWIARFVMARRASFQAASAPAIAHRLMVPLALALCATGCMTAPARAADFAVGEARISVAAPGDVRGDDSRQLHVIVWYPAIAGAVMQPMVEGPPSVPFFQEGASAPDAPIAAGPRTFPLIVASHGSGSTAAEIGWFAAGLAAGGYVVVAVDHPG